MVCEKIWGFTGPSRIMISSLMMLELAQAWQPRHVAITLLLVMVFSLTGATLHGYLVLRRM